MKGYQTMKINKTGYLGIAAAVALLFCAAINHPAHAAAPTPECLSLTAEQSEDKNYYNFKATASTANNASIIGYEFSFGDQQSYRFNFYNVPDKDRGTATVKHTYEKSKDYTATVSVISSANGKEAKASSPSCSTHVTVGLPVVAELPTTGLSTESSLLIALGLGLITYKVVLTIRTARSITPL